MIWKGESAKVLEGAEDEEAPIVSKASLVGMESSEEGEELTGAVEVSRLVSEAANRCKGAQRPGFSRAVLARTHTKMVIFEGEKKLTHGGNFGYRMVS